ncbi:MAG: PaaI family thioesterase [Methanosarcinales archaeon]|nr:PaaI family thioesterase [Methanosarcinales archaeon]
MDVNQIKAFFENDKFAEMTGIVIEEITDNEVVCSLNIEKKHSNSVGTVQGGAVFTLADFTFAIACNSEDLKNGSSSISVAQSCNISFFKPAKGDKLISKAICLQKGKRISVYRMEITDNLGTNVAEMTANAYRIEK